MIKFDNVNFTYAENKNKSLEVNAVHVKKGECIVVTGTSGSGKSTFTKIINGLIPYFFEGELKGNVFLNKKDIQEMSVCEVSQIVASVFQDPSSQFFTNAVDSELAFTCENFGLERDVIINNMVNATLLTQIEDLLGEKLEETSGGQKQKVAIATALTLPIKILLLDEPSSNLDFHAIEILTTILKKLKNKGYTIVIAEHRLYYLKELFDRVFYLKSGKILYEYNAQEFLQLSNSNLHKLGLRSFDLFSNKLQSAIVTTSQKNIEFHNLSYTFPKAKQATLENINFDCNMGDVIALVGINGAGKTTLARLIAGIYKNKNASFVFHNKNVKAKNLYKYVNFVMQDVSYQLFGDSVFNELKIGNEDVDNLDEKIHFVLEHLELAHLKNAHPFSLSMGQRQRLVLATTYIRQTPLTILDEPTSGLDFLNMKKVSHLIDELATNKKSSLIITHDYEFICQTCNRLLLLEGGTIKKDFYLKGNEQLLKEIFLKQLKHKK